MTQSQFLQLAVEILERLKIEYALVGSIASSTWGEPRFTHDIDIVVRLDVFEAISLCDGFPSEEFYVSKTAAEEAVKVAGQFNVLHPASLNKIDFMVVGETNWADAQLNRRVLRPVLESGSCYVATAEDIILGKLIYYREGGSEKHIRDITGMLTRMHEGIDRAYIQHHATELGVLEEWLSIVRKLDEMRR